MKQKSNFLAKSRWAFLFVMSSVSAIAAPPPTPTWTDAKLAATEHPGFSLLGEYVRGDQAIQVVPCKDRFYISIYRGGLPGNGWDGSPIKHEWLDTEPLKARLKDFQKLDRSSKLTSLQPPSDAIVLFDGTNMDQWAYGKAKYGLLQAGAKTKRKFKDFTLHFECLIPFKPELPISHPDRGNSGVFALGAYEVQIADTFGLDLDPNAWKSEKLLKKPSTACGGIYGTRAADVNMCLPPLSWQYFDVIFTAARFEGDKKISNARMSVTQNGVLIHNNVQVPEGTGGGPRGPRPEVTTGPILFQNHHNPTQYRNIWVVENSAPGLDNKAGKK